MRGGAFWKIKFLFTKADAGVIKGFRTKADLAWGGSHLEKKIPLHQGSPRRDRGICMNEILVRRLVNSEILFRTTRQVSMNERIRVGSKNRVS